MSFTKDKLVHLWSKITGLFDTVNDKISDLDSRKVDAEEGKSLISDTEIERLSKVDNYDDTILNNQITVLELTKANKSDIYTKTETDKQITDEIAKVVADAPEDFDTLKEMSDWITNHEDSAASMNSAIQQNASDIVDLQSNKVDKEDGKSLIDDTEIERLSKVDNYDDTVIKSDIVKNISDISSNSTAISELQSNKIGFTDYATSEKVGVVKIGSGLSYGEDGAITTKPATQTEIQDESSDNTIISPSNAKYLMSEYGINSKTQIGEMETVIGNKVDTEEGKGLSTNDYTTAEKEKLTGLENYDDTQLVERLSKLEEGASSDDYSYTYSGSSTDKINYYYCVSESTVTGTSKFESIQLVLALRQVSVLNSNSAKFGIIQVQGRYDQNSDGTDDNTFTVVNVNWVLSSNIQTDNFFVVYNNTEKKIRLYYKSNSTYDGVVAQKIFDDINSPSTLANPTTLVKDIQGIATLPEDWIIASQVNSTTSNADFRVLADIVLNNPEIAVYNAGNKKILYGSKIEENGTVSAAAVSSFKNLATGKCEIFKGYKSIGDCAFYGCTSLTEMNIPDSVTSIGEIAFEKCSSLKSVIIPNSISILKNGTFFDCTSLTSVTIPDSVTVMEENIFANCTSITEITIPNSVTSIGSGAFNRCASLTTITINKSQGSISGSPWGATNATVVWAG